MSQIEFANLEHEQSRRKFFDPLIRRSIERDYPATLTPLTDYEAAVKNRKGMSGVSDAKLMGLGLVFGSGMHAAARPAIRLEIALGSPHEQFLTDHRNAIIGGVTLLGVSTGLYLGLWSRE